MMIYKSPKEKELIDKLDPLVDSLHFELRDVEVRPGQPALVRVTIDLKDRSRGVNLEDCYEVHQLLGPLFDVWDPIEMAYTLEVSSPGEKAPLRSFSHFKEAIGGEIEFKTREALKIEFNPTAAPRKKWRGILLEVLESDLAEDSFTLKLEDSMGIHHINSSLVEQAKWLRNWTAKIEKKEGSSKGPFNKAAKDRPKKGSRVK